MSPFEAVGEFAAGRLSKEDFDGIERCALPGTGACGGMYTANTMSSRVRGAGHEPARIRRRWPIRTRKRRTARRSRPKCSCDAIEKQILPRQIVTRKAIENAVSVVMAVGGSTNAVLHFLAIAHAADVAWTIDDFERIRQRVPVLCDLKPSGRYVATDLHRAGGVPQVMKMLLDHGLMHGDCMTITGQTIAEVLADVPPAPRADQDVIRPWSNPMYPQGHLAILRGNLATEGCVAKITGLKNPAITGPARVFDSEPAAMDAIMANSIKSGDVIVIRYEGPEGRPRHARDARRRPRRWSARATPRTSA